MKKMATSILKKYIEKVTDLKRDKAHGVPTLHKPLLLLTVIELIEQGEIQENKIVYSTALRKTFRKYCSKVKQGSLIDVLPFYHLTGDGFWHHQPNVGQKTELKNVGQIKTISVLNKLVAYAYLDKPLFVLLAEPQDRECIRQALIDKYFSDFKQEIADLIEEEQNIRRQEIKEYRKSLIENSKGRFSLYNPHKQIVSIQRKTPVRSAGFRQEIMQIYDYTCAVCGLRVCIDGKSITDAAHIAPFHKFHNDDLRNGISLCKSHHWAFDEGLISLDFLNNAYKIIISPIISQCESSEWLFTKLKGMEMARLPDDKQQYPAQEALEWHREEVLRQ